MVTTPKAWPRCAKRWKRVLTAFYGGDFYGMGHNKMLLGEALRNVGCDRAQLSVTFGAQRDPAGVWLGFDDSAIPIRVDSLCIFSPGSSRLVSGSLT